MLSQKNVNDSEVKCERNYICIWKFVFFFSDFFVLFVPLSIIFGLTTNDLFKYNRYIINVSNDLCQQSSFTFVLDNTKSM